MSVESLKLDHSAGPVHQSESAEISSTDDEEAIPEFEMYVERVTPGELKATGPFCHEEFKDHPRKNHHLKGNCVRRGKTKEAVEGKIPPVEYELYIEEDSEDDKPTCQICQKSFRDYASRNRHLVSTHNSIKDDNLAPRFVIDVEQEYMEKDEARGRKKKTLIKKNPSTLRSRCGLLKSRRKVENKEDESTLKSSEASNSAKWILYETIRCQEQGCSMTFPFVQDLRNHLMINHNYQQLGEVKLVFPSLLEFEDWKRELELESNTKWVKHHSKTFELYRVIIYGCIIMIGLRNRGKSDAHCTSQIIVKAFKGRKGQLEVSYFPGHYGHDPLQSFGWKKLEKRKLKTSQPKANPRKRKRQFLGEDNSERTCHVCLKIFSSQQVRDKHVEKFHEGGEVPTTDKGSVECFEPNCGKRFRIRRFLRAHLVCDHNFEMKITPDVLRFATKEEFDEWKSTIEEETQSYYKVRQQDKNKTYKKTIQYVCCRSGKMFNTDNRKRPLKIQGSRRSNIHCTSEIKLRYLDEGFQVEYYKEHYGHDNSLVHLPVPKKVKQEIKEKLLAGQDVGSILRELRLSASDQVSRKHFIRKKDVYNIQQSIGVKNPRFANLSKTNEITDIDTWVKKTITSFGGLIIFYKPVGECFEELDETDFVVVCMTPFQRQMALQFGGDRICVDSTFDEMASKHVCELTTILAVNEFEEAIPLAFCLSSRVNLPILKLFFSSVRDVIGGIACHTFVGIEAPQFHVAWCQIMGTPQCHVMCAWHIDTAWKLKLGRIMDRDKRLWIYERLKACQLQCDINEFSEMFESLLYDLNQSEDTKYVFHYINEYYTNRPELWANAHKIGIKINTNLYLDNFHRSIRRSFMQGRDKRRLDKCIIAVNNYIMDREYDQLAEYCRRKVLIKMNDIASCHEAGMALVSAVSAIIDSSCWAVSSSSQDLIYVVNKVESHNCNSSCLIYCGQCTACLKGYNCSCDDNAIRGNVCQHLHAVAGYLKSSEDAIQYIVIEGNDEVLIAHDGVMTENYGEAEGSHGTQEEESRLVDEERVQVLDKYGRIIDDDYKIIVNDDQIIDNDEQILVNDDNVIANDVRIINGDGIDNYDEIIYNDDEIIGSDDQIVDIEDQIIEEHKHNQIVDQGINEEGDQIVREYDDDETDYYAPSEKEGHDDVSRLHVKNSNPKMDLVSTALQLMGDLAGFEDSVPESVSDQVKNHIEMARMLLQKSMAASNHSKR
uniref:C2H2-type domain-containing protein n=1 Tax=Lygus hesperus TaxID=30085 RepID=A0A146KRK5_LYGHE